MSASTWTPLDINLCSGAGGLALGLTQAGFSPTEFFDLDAGSCETLRHNLLQPSNPLRGRVFEGDLTQIEWVPANRPVRLLAAGAPCQPFSMGGSHRGHADERNLFPTIMKAIRHFRPKGVLIENVRGLSRESHRPYLDYILRQLRFPSLDRLDLETWPEHDQRLLALESEGYRDGEYDVSWAVFNAADFGVAQIRHRLFVVATRADVPKYSFPAPTHSKRRLLLEQQTGRYWDARGLPVPESTKIDVPTTSAEMDLLPWVTVRDEIADLVDPARAESRDCNNHWVIPGARSYPGHTGSTLDQPSKALKAGVHGVPGGENMMICDDGTVKYFTLRQMARLQSFPDTHYFVGARSNIVRQIGNAVPCELAKQVAMPLRNLFGDVERPEIARSEL